MKLSIVKDVIFRSIALFMTMALPAIGAGAFAGVEPVQSALIAGALGVSKVLTDLAKAFLDDGQLTQEEVDAIYFGTLAAIVEPGASVLFTWMKRAVGKVPIIFDPNIRPTVLGDRERYQGAVARFLQIADVVKASTEDIAWLYPEMHEFEVAKSWLAHGVKLVVITRGEKGLVGITTEHVIEVPGIEVDVVDTVGAGDTVGAILAEGILTHGLERALAAELSHILHRAVQASAITCSRQGAQPPYKKEL